MAKKLILLATAIAVCAAVAIPALASAAFTLKDHEGKVEPGQWVIGTSINTKVTNTVFTDPMHCPHIEAAAEVQTNSGALITAAKGSVSLPTDCTVGGEELTVTTPALTHLGTSGGEEGNLSLFFVADVGAFECPYGGTVGFTYATGTGNGTLLVKANQTLTSPFEFCEPEEGHPTFDGTYTLSTTDGSEVWVESGA